MSCFSDSSLAAKAASCNSPSWVKIIVGSFGTVPVQRTPFSILYAIGVGVIVRSSRNVCSSLLIYQNYRRDFLIDSVKGLRKSGKDAWTEH